MLYGFISRSFKRRRCRSVFNLICELFLSNDWILFYGKYKYIMFSFVTMTRVIHFLTFHDRVHAQISTNLTVVIRVFVSSMFFALYMSQTLGIEVLIISLFDLQFASLYLIFLNRRLAL